MTTPVPRNVPTERVVMEYPEYEEDSDFDSLFDCTDDECCDIRSIKSEASCTEEDMDLSCYSELGDDDRDMEF